MERTNYCDNKWENETSRLLSTVCKNCSKKGSGPETQISFVLSECELHRASWHPDMTCGHHTLCKSWKFSAFWQFGAMTPLLYPLWWSSRTWKWEIHLPWHTDLKTESVSICVMTLRFTWQSHFIVGQVKPRGRSKIKTRPFPDDWHSQSFVCDQLFSLYC